MGEGLREVVAKFVYCGDDYCDTLSPGYRSRECQDCAEAVNKATTAALAWVDARLGEVRDGVALRLCGYREVPVAGRTGDLAWQVWGEALDDADAALDVVRGVLGLEVER